MNYSPKPFTAYSFFYSASLAYYNVVLYLYSIAIQIASLAGHTKARLRHNGQRDWQRQLREFTDSFDAPMPPFIWVHCASVGEFEQGRPVIEALRHHYPYCRIVLTFYSPSGYELRKNYALADYIAYLPLDTAANARFFIENVQPQMVFFIKYEYWYHYLSELHKRQIPTYLVSAIFRPEQVFFKPWGILFKPLLSVFRQIFVQDERSKQLLQSLDVHRVSVTGDTRFDRVSKNAQHKQNLPVAEHFSANKTVIVAGSTWPPDEKCLMELLPLISGKTWGLVVVPHEIKPAAIAELYRQMANIAPTVRYSEFAHANTKPLTPKEIEMLAFAKVLIIDNVGMLSNLYRYAHYAYIGGGFGRGIHNCLEAVVYGLPVFWGPNYTKFKEARDLIDLKAAQSVLTAGDIYQHLNKMQRGSPQYDHICRVANQYVNGNTGSTAKIISFLIKQHPFLDNGNY